MCQRIMNRQRISGLELHPYIDIGQSINVQTRTRDIKIFAQFIFLGSICPRRHNIIGMISGVVCRQSISGLEVLTTDNA